VGDNSQGEFYSVALTNNYQQADTGTKMLHIGQKYTKSNYFKRNFGRKIEKTVIEVFVNVTNKAVGARNYSQCDSIINWEFIECKYFSIYFSSKFNNKN
jgi:Fe-S cluster assembly protein SufB